MILQLTISEVSNSNIFTIWNFKTSNLYQDNSSSRLPSINADDGLLIRFPRDNVACDCIVQSLIYSLWHSLHTQNL